MSLDTSALSRIERDPILGEVVEVSTSSRLAPLIAELGNADWVARGQPYTHKDQCPFCQQGLPHDFREELARLLEGERKAKVDRIALLVQNYAAQLDALEQRAQTILADPDAKEAGVELAWSQTHGAFHETLTVLRQKEAQPGVTVSIVPVNVDALVEALAKLNALIADFNARIRDRRGERDRIKAMLFQVMHAERSDAYAHHDALLVPLQDAETQAKADLNAKRQERDALNTELRDLRQLQKGIDASIDAINDRLRSLGITAFSIDRKVDEDRVYCLARPGVASSETKSLSEGEKTLISVLYFMESLKGSHDENENVDPHRTIAVIDDPISSLSQNYVYDIATMIHRELAKPQNRPQLVKQVIVLTHNLFFFHELIRQHSKTLEKAHTCELSGLNRSAPTFKLSLPSVGLTRRGTWQRVMVDRLGRPVVARRAARLPAALEAPLGGRRPSQGCRLAATATTRLRSVDYGSISQAGDSGAVDGTGGG